MKKHLTNSGITGAGAGGKSAPQTSDWEISADLPGKKRQGRKGKGVKIEKKRRKIVKGKVKNWRWKVEKLENEERTPPLFYFYFFFFAFHFSKPRICFGTTKMEIFYREKAFHAGKTGKMTLPPSKKFSFYTSANKNSASLASSPKVKVMRGSCWGKNVLHF